MFLLPEHQVIFGLIKFHSQLAGGREVLIVQISTLDRNLGRELVWSPWVWDVQLQKYRMKIATFW